MSEWTNISGRHTSKRVSLERLVNNIYDECFFERNTQQNNKIWTNFNFSIETDGVEAANVIRDIIKEFNIIDPKAFIEMTAEIKFYGYPKKKGIKYPI